MFKYVFFVILGILIYLLYNRSNGFSVGGQLTQNLQQLNEMAIRIAKGMDDPGEQLCAISGVGQCQIDLNAIGGSCSINALAGLLYTSASFTPEYQGYLNRQGTSLKFDSVSFETYSCIMNMPNMVPTLVSNRLNPKKTIYHILPSDNFLNINEEISIK